MRRQSRRFWKKRSERTEHPWAGHPSLAEPFQRKRARDPISELIQNVEEIPTYRARVQRGRRRGSRTALRAVLSVLLIGLVVGVTIATNLVLHAYTRHREQVQAFQLLADEVEENLQQLLTEAPRLRLTQQNLDSGVLLDAPLLEGIALSASRWNALAARLDLFSEGTLYADLSAFYASLDRLSAEVARYNTAAAAWNQAVGEAQRDTEGTGELSPATAQEYSTALARLLTRLDESRQQGEALQQKLLGLASRRFLPLSLFP
ncbi:MAG: hypothetical protein KatS3mg115_2509 [Candidatus Poribacteria bacterium]|nr:MAG: hypothetical protein KatS3mg115_2509 [Candidatus Poribacteria bacterium]